MHRVRQRHRDGAAVRSIASIVKNNLQVISSLLKLQAESMSDQKTKTALMASHGRVNSMSMVHEMFYQSGDLRQLELGPFLRNLAASLRAAYDLEIGSIEIRVTVDPVQVPLDTAIRVGLVVNELVLNALKHAFTDPSQRGLIQILMSVEEGSAELTVVDDGKGLPEGFSWTETDSLGLQLVQNLARQLHGDIWLDTSNGTAFHLRFPITAEVEALGAANR